MSTIRVVLDTNVVVSAHLSSEGYERSVLDLALAGKLRMFASEAILREYESVLRRPKFQCAEVSAADYLVTGNKRHFPGQWRQTLIVNARELLEWTIPEMR